MNNGPVGDDNKYYRLGLKEHQDIAVDWAGFIGGTGNMWSMG